MEAELVSYLLYILNVVLNVASAVCGSLVVVIIMSCMWVSFQSMNRVSIRFTLGISVVDVLKALILLVYNQFTEDGMACVTISFVFHYLTLLYLFLNVAVALNLQLVFVHGIIFGRWVEVCYWAVSLVLPLVLLSFPAGAGRLGLDADAMFCEFRDPKSTETNLYVYLCFLVWGFSACIYCTVAVGLVTYKLSRKSNILDCITSKRKKLLNQSLRVKIHQLITRVSLYCVIPITTQIWYLILRVIASYTEEAYYSLIFLSVISSDLPGVLNLLVLLIDPAFATAIESIIKQKSPTATTKDDPSPKLELKEELKEEIELAYQSNDIGFFVPIQSRLSTQFISTPGQGPNHHTIEASDFIKCI